MKKTLRE